MNLHSASVRKLRVPLGRTIGDNNCAYDAFDVCAVELKTKDGLTGWGFGEKVHGGQFKKAVSWKSEMETQVALQSFLSGFWSQLEGRSVDELLDGLPKYWEPLDIPNHLLGAIRMGLWDLKGKLAGKPLYKLLGGEDAPSSKFTYASPCGYPQSHEWVVDHFRSKVESGFTAIKVKVGGEDMDRDMTRLHLVREAVGPDVQISVDGNTGWDGPRALEWMARAQTEGIKLHYVEDPCSPHDVDAYKLLAKESPLPIVGHDYLPNPEDLRPLLDTGAIRQIRIRDGIDHAIEAVKIAREYGLTVVVTNTFGEHAAHYGLAVPELERIEFADIGWNDLFVEPFHEENGSLVAPSGNGLGLEPKPHLLTDWQVDE